MRCQFIMALGLMPIFGLSAQTAQPASADSLPALPSVQPTYSPENPRISTTLPSSESNFNTPQTSRRMPTQEELEKVRKDRNWMVEGMKEQQAARNSEAAANRQNTDMSDSIIDMVLNKKKKTDLQKTPATRNTPPTQETNNSPEKKAGTTNTFKPALSSNAYESSSPGDTGAIKLPDNLMSSILQDERAAAKQAGFRENTAKRTGKKNGLAALDALNNPFSNLPIPEDALPQNPNSLSASSARNDPFQAPAAPNINPMMAQEKTNAFQPSVTAGASPSTGTAGTMATPTTPGAIAIAPAGPAAPKVAVEQPYTILREQELIRRQQQSTSNRPKVQDLRSPIPDPSEARLF
ncbi:MAG: hypothetical protein SFU85_01065 [Candidatus Methylacidiphilales bacterium]|nr:hypothetical protein [Candidatus Methylacidiphilales bacterium]